MNLLKRLFREEEGVTLIEYALIAALIAIAAIVTLGLVGGQINALFQQVLSALGGGGGGS
jgi:pilus assembly protein Flp/PilA